MDAGDKVAALEALLARVQENAGTGRPRRGRAPAETHPGVPPMPAPPGSTRPVAAAAPPDQTTIKGTGPTPPPKVPKASSLKIDVPADAGYEDPFAEGWDLEEPAPKNITKPTPPPAKPSDPSAILGSRPPPQRSATPPGGSPSPLASTMTGPRSNRGVPKPLRSTFSSRSSASFAAVGPTGLPKAPDSQETTVETTLPDAPISAPPATPPRAKESAPEQPPTRPTIGQAPTRLMQPAPEPSPPPPEAPAAAPADAAPKKHTTTLVSVLPGAPADRPVNVAVEAPGRPSANEDLSDFTSTLASEEPAPKVSPAPPRLALPEVPAPAPAPVAAAPVEAPSKATPSPPSGLGSTIIMADATPAPAAPPPAVPSPAVPSADDDRDIDLGATIPFDPTDREPAKLPEGFDVAATEIAPESKPAARVPDSIPPPLEPLEAKRPVAAPDDNPWVREAANKRSPGPPPKGRSAVWLGVALVALLVGGAYFAYQRLNPARVEVVAPTAETGKPRPTGAVEDRKTADPDRTSRVGPTGAPTDPTTAPSASAAASADPTTPPAATGKVDPTGGPNLAALPVDQGLLTVRTDQPARVFIFGREVGAAGQALQIKCGTVNVRIAKPGAANEAIEWLSAGEPVLVGCQKSTDVTVAATAAP